MLSKRKDAEYQRSLRQLAQVSSLSPVDLRKLCNMIGLVGNRQVAFALGVAETTVQHYFSGRVPVPLVVEKALSFEVYVWAARLASSRVGTPYQVFGCLEARSLLRRVKAGASLPALRDWVDA